MKLPPKPPAIEIFGDMETVFAYWYEGTNDHYYWYVYNPPKLSQENRERLKFLGWKPQQHPRTKQECWFFPERFWIAQKEL